MKVVINGCYGGFSVSVEAARWMAERGHAEATAEIATYDAGVSGARELSDLERKFDVHWFGFICCERDADRADQLLVGVVEALGAQANGQLADLRVVEIPDNVEWTISAYDGMEHVAEAHRTWA